MKAIVSEAYGSPDVLQIQEIVRPSPKANEVLIKVIAASVTTADTMIRRGTPRYGRLFLGLFKPNHRIPGTGFAGTIEEIGVDVSSFKVDDRVFGESIQTFGTHAEYLCIPEDGLITILPEDVTYEEAAPICDGAVTSMNFLKNLADIKSGQSILIIGASGSLGTAAVQLAVHFGAKVTGVCSAANTELVKSLGAHHVIDYTKEDFTKGGKTYDVIYDTVGKSEYGRCKNSLTKDGVYMCPVLNIKLLLLMLLTSVTGSKRAKFSATGFLPVPQLQGLLAEIKNLINAGHVKMIIDRRYPLEDVAKAHQYIDTGHKKGNVVMTTLP